MGIGKSILVAFVEDDHGAVVPVLMGGMQPIAEHLPPQGQEVLVGGWRQAFLKMSVDDTKTGVKVAVFMFAQGKLQMDQLGELG